VLIVAKEVGLFKKYNLDPTLVFTTGDRWASKPCSAVMLP
jgi:hypothetical protein